MVQHQVWVKVFIIKMYCRYHFGSLVSLVWTISLCTLNLAQIVQKLAEIDLLCFSK